MNDISQLLVNHAGPVLFAIVFVEQAGLPFPSAPWLLAAGALSANGELNPAIAIGETALAAVTADLIWFFIGRRGRQRVLRMFCWLSLEHRSCIGRTKRVLAQNGLRALLVAKFLPGLGAVMPPLAGALGMSTRRFLLFDGLGSSFYGTFYILVGFIFHNQLQQAMRLLKELGFSLFMLMLLLFTGYILLKYVRRHSRPGKRSTTLLTRSRELCVIGPSRAVAGIQGPVWEAGTTKPNALNLEKMAAGLTNVPFKGMEAPRDTPLAVTSCNL